MLRICLVFVFTLGTWGSRSLGCPMEIAASAEELEARRLLISGVVAANGHEFKGNLNVFPFLVKYGVPLDNLTFEVLNIPPGARPFYDRKTGVFTYATDRPARLALGNGDQPFQTLRIHLNPSALLRNGHSTMGLYEELRKIVDERMLMMRVFVGSEDRMVRINGEQVRGLVDAEIAKLDEGLARRIKFHISPGGVHGFPTDESAQSGPSELIIPQSQSLGVDQERVIRNGLDIVREIRLYDLRETIFRIDWGDVLTAERHIFVGGKTIADNIRLLRIGYKEVIAALSVEFGKPVIAVDASQFGNEFWNLNFHLDLLMAVARDRNSGGEVALLSSPYLARNMLDFAESPSPGAEELRRVLWHPSQQSMIKSWDLFNAYAEGLMRSLGYSVDRLPGYSFILPNFQNPERPKRHVYNYTNVQLGGDLVLLGHMGIPELDRFADTKYHGFGYDLCALPSIVDYLVRGGGVRCSVHAMRAMPKQP